MKKITRLFTAVLFVTGLILTFSAQSIAAPACCGYELLTNAESCGERLVGASATVNNHVMGLYPPPQCPTAPPEVTTFDPGDKAMNWNYTTGCVSGDTYRFDWYAPDGTKYYSTGTLTSTANYCIYSSFGDGIPDKPGSWSVIFTYNGSQKYTDYFTVSDGGPPIWPSVYDKLFGNNSNELNTLRAFRNDVLCANPMGRAHVDRLYQRSHEVALILLLNRDLRTRTRQVLDFIMPEVENVLQGEGLAISVEELEQIDDLLEDFAKKGSPELQSLIKAIQAELWNEDTTTIYGVEVDVYN